MLRLLGVIPALLLSVFPLAAELTATAPRDLTPPKFSTSEYDERNPRIASDGRSFVAVWDNSELEVRATRISGTGDVAHVTGHDPDVVWNGESFLAAFVETHTRVIEWQLVSLDGTARTPSVPFIPIDAPRYVVTVHATTFASGTLLAWNDGAASPVVALLNTDGTIREYRTSFASAPTYMAILAAGSILFHSSPQLNEEGIPVRVTARKLTRR